MFHKAFCALYLGVVLLLLNACAGSTGISGIPDRVADKAIGEADTYPERAARFTALSLLVCETATDRAMTDSAHAIPASAACLITERSIKRLAIDLGGPWKEVGFHTARFELYRAARAGLNVDLDLGLGLRGMVKALLAVRNLGDAIEPASKLSAMRRDIQALFMPADGSGDLAAVDLPEVTKILTDRIEWNLGRLGERDPMVSRLNEARAAGV